MREPGGGARKRETGEKVGAREGERGHVTTVPRERLDGAGQQDTVKRLFWEPNGLLHGIALTAAAEKERRKGVTL